MFAGPGGYAKVASSNGGAWAQVSAYGGNSGSSAYAGPDGTIASAGSGGYAVAMYGRGREFEGKMVTPGGDYIHRHRDGSTRVDKVTYSDEDEGALGYSGGYR